MYFSSKRPFYRSILEFLKGSYEISSNERSYDCLSNVKEKAFIHFQFNFLSAFLKRLNELPFPCDDELRSGTSMAIIKDFPAHLLMLLAKGKPVSRDSVTIPSEADN